MGRRRNEAGPGPTPVLRPWVTTLGGPGARQRGGPPNPVRALRALFTSLVLLQAGCSVDTGAVEWAWVFVDQDGDTIFPGGVFDLGRTDACGLPGTTSEGGVRFDLSVELTICDPTCTQGCEDPDCQVIAPLGFDCNNSRGSNPSVPSDDAPYQFRLNPVLSLPDDVECRDLTSCIAAPGPRERVVKPGLVTDLQVFQLVVGLDIDAPAAAGGSLDLEACGCA